MTIDLKQIYEAVTSPLASPSITVMTRGARPGGIPSAPLNNGFKTQIMPTSSPPVRFPNTIDVSHRLKTPNYTTKDEVVETLDLNMGICADVGGQPMVVQPNSTYQVNVCKSGLVFGQANCHVDQNEFKNICRRQIMDAFKSNGQHVSNGVCQLLDWFERAAKNKDTAAVKDLVMSIDLDKVGEFVELLSMVEDGFISEADAEDVAMQLQSIYTNTTNLYGQKVQKTTIPTELRNATEDDIRTVIQLDSVLNDLGFQDNERQKLNGLIRQSCSTDNQCPVIEDTFNKLKSFASLQSIDIDIRFVPTVLDLIAMYVNANKPDIPKDVLITLNHIDDNANLRESQAYDTVNEAFNVSQLPFSPIYKHFKDVWTGEEVADRLITAVHQRTTPFPDHKPNMMRRIIASRDAGDVLTKFSVEKENGFIEWDLITDEGVYVIFKDDNRYKYDEVITSYILTIDQFLNVIDRPAVKHLGGIINVAKDRLDMRLVVLLASNVFRCQNRIGLYPGSDVNIFIENPNSRRYI